MNVFELFATLSLDKKEYEKGLTESEEKAYKVGQGIGTALNSGVKALGKAMATAAKISAAAIGAGATAVGALATQSVKAYGEYEQLVGGVKKLFGNMGLSIEEYAQQQGKSVDEVRDEWIKLGTAQNEVLQNAKRAFETVGMDTNTYLQNATSFSAALIKSLGGDTVKAASQVDLAMQSIADNVNTFGTDMESVTNAFMGFSKQNYTMLDNLKLGYGGTKEGMKQLIADANAYAKTIGQTANLSIDSFSDIVTAIDLIQQKQNIAGTTAREAATTIQGSLSMLKASWSNLVAGFASKDANIGELIKNVISSAETAFNNLLPVAEKALSGIASAVGKFAPVIAMKLPELFQQVVPSLLKGASNLVTALTRVLPSLLKTLLSQVQTVLPTLISGAKGLITAFTGVLPDLVKAIADILPDVLTTLIPAVIEGMGTLFVAIIDALPDLITGLVEALPEMLSSIGESLKTVWDKLKESGPQLLTIGKDLLLNFLNGFIEGIPDLAKNVLPIILTISQNIRENFGNIVDTGIQLLLKLADGIVQALPYLIEYIPQIITNIMGLINDNMPKLLEAGWNIITTLATGVIENIPVIIENFGNIMQMIVSIISAINWLNLGKNIIELLGKGVKMLATSLPELLKKIGQEGFKFFKNIDWWGLGKDVIMGILAGLKAAAHFITEFLVGMASNALESIKGFFGIHSPSTVMRDQVGKNIALGMAYGISQNADAVTKAMEDLESIPAVTLPEAKGETSTTFGGYNQTVNIYSPTELSPSEVARQTRNASRSMVLALRGV